MRVVLSLSAGETERAASEIAKNLAPGSVLLLKGGLGAGKTTFVRGLAKGLKVKRLSDVRSPTFSLIHEYLGK